MRHRMSSLLTFALFASFAFVQRNDPDPWPWIALYLAGGGLCVALAFGVRWRRAARAVAMAAALLGAWWLTQLEAWSVDDEVVREAGGFWVVALAVGLYSRNRPSTSTRPRVPDDAA